MIWFLISICCICWFILGVYSFIYWWTKEWDITIAEIPICIMVGLAGPFSFFSGLMIHCCDLKSDKVLIKKRG